MKNKVQLICYIDRFSGGDIQSLGQLLRGPLKEVFGACHLLPFFYPIDGSDAGFDPIDHNQVDPRLGNWQDIKVLSEEIELVADLIVNHISSKSPEFEDYLTKGNNSKYKDLFLKKSDVFPESMSNQEERKIYRPRPGLPFTEIKRSDGVCESFWTTFTPQQIDINVESPAGREYLERILRQFASSGIKLVRLDAAGYAIKRAGTSCFMLPETYEFIKEIQDSIHQLGMKLLVEIHSHYKTQIQIAKSVDFVYDFALPPLILHALFYKTGEYLDYWLKIRPTNSITVLDTHDGIGIRDIGKDASNPTKSGLIPDDELDFLVEEVARRSNGQSEKATGKAASNLDLYQVNCSYYDALGADDNLYLLARAIQFFIPGIPQVYYMGALCQGNDMELLQRTGVGRDINRHYFQLEELNKLFERPSVQRQFQLMRLRNEHPAFDGNFSWKYKEKKMVLNWLNQSDTLELSIDFLSLEWNILSTGSKRIDI